jgi:NADPH:quinone reductase-like Zn-dependent oxidoreductase
LVEGERIVFPGPGQVAVEPFTTSETDLGAYEVVVRTRTTLISPGTELARLHGKLAFEDDVPPDYPMEVVGYANIGTVIAAGSELKVRPGDRVYTMANHASVARVDARHFLCVPVPEGLSDERAVFVRLATVSMTTLVTTFARPGDRVVIRWR